MSVVPPTAAPLGKKLLVTHEYGALFKTRQRRVFRIAAFRCDGHPPYFLAALRWVIAVVFRDGRGAAKHRNQNTRCAQDKTDIADGSRQFRTITSLHKLSFKLVEPMRDSRIGGNDPR